MHRERGFVGIGDGLIGLDQDDAFGQSGDDLLQLRAVDVFGHGWVWAAGSAAATGAGCVGHGVTLRCLHRTRQATRPRSVPRRRREPCPGRAINKQREGASSRGTR